MNKKLNETFRPKSTDEIIQAFCSKYEIEYTIQDDILDVLQKKINENKYKKIETVRQQNFEILIMMLIL